VKEIEEKHCFKVLHTEQGKKIIEHYFCDNPTQYKLIEQEIK
jgi:hypothetical protein